MLEEALTTVLPNLSSSKRGLRKFVVSEDDGLSIQMVSALILRMLQVRNKAPFALRRFQDNHDSRQCYAFTCLETITYW